MTFVAFLLSWQRDSLDDEESLNGDVDDDPKDRELKQPSLEEDLRLKNAATIGTALLVINSHRAMLLL